MTVKIMYPYDPSRTNDECYFSKESHILTTNDNDFRVMVPEMAPFFSKDLIIRHAVSGLELTEGKDYNLGGEIISAEVIASLPLYSYISIVNKALLGEFLIDYGSVGHTFVGVRSEVLTYLANVLNDPVKTPLDQVLLRPIFYLPHRHDMHWSDSVNKEGLTAGLATISSRLDLDENQAFSNLANELTQAADVFTSKLDATGYTAHVANMGNPHNTTNVQVDALPTVSSAVDSFKIFGKSLADFSSYVNARGIVQADVDNYVDDRGNRSLGGKIILKDGQAKLRNGNNDVVIDLSSGAVKMYSKGSVTLAAETGNFQMSSGLNELTIAATSEVMSFNALTFNDHVVFNEMTLKDALVGFKPQRAGVVTANSSTIDLAGTGKDASKLSGTLKTTIATLTARGTVKKLSDNYLDTATDTAPTANAIRKLRIHGETYVPMSRTINGHPLTSDVTVTKADINLGSVNNTNDAEKPISTPQQAYLDTFIDKVHKHDYDDIDWDVSNINTVGEMQLVDTPTAAIISGGVATPASVLELQNKTVDIQTKLDGKLARDVLSVSYWKPTVAPTANAWVVVISNACILYMDGVDYQRAELPKPITASFNLAVMYPGTVVNTNIYFYLENLGGTVVYTAKKDLLDNDVGRLFLFAVQTTGSGISTEVKNGFAHRSGTSLIVTTFPSMGRYRELAEHIASSTSHLGASTGGGGGNVSIPELSEVENFNVAQGISVFSHASMMSWEKSSGSFDAVGDIVLSHIAGQTYGNGSTSINYLNSTKFPVLRSKARILDVAAREGVIINITQRQMCWMVNADSGTEHIDVMLFSKKTTDTFLDWIGVRIDLPSASKAMNISAVRGTKGVSERYCKTTNTAINGTSKVGRISVTILSSPTSPELCSVTVGYVSIEPGGNRFAEVTIVIDPASNKMPVSAATFQHAANSRLTSATAVDRTNVNTVSADIGVDAAVRSLVEEGTFGFGFLNQPTANSKVSVQLVGSYDSGKDQYVSAMAVLDYLKSGGNISVQTGRTVGPLPMSWYGTRALVLWSYSDLLGGGATVMGMENYLRAEVSKQKLNTMMIDLTRSTDLPEIYGAFKRNTTTMQRATMNYMIITMMD